jgi:hypothetical protein
MRTSQGNGLRLTLAVLWVAGCLLSRQAIADESPYVAILLNSHIEPNGESLAKYLTELHPSKDQLAKTKALIEQLGDPKSFHAREAAMAQLLIMPTLPSEALVEATKGDDPEIRWRAQRVLDVGKPESGKVMHAAFKLIAEQKTPGVLQELIAALPLCDEKHLLVAAQEAIAAAATKDDLALLRKTLAAGDSPARVACVTAISNVLGTEALADLTPLLADGDDQVKLVATRGIANLGDRQALAALLALLSSEDLQVRVSASSALRQFTGQQIPFAAYDVADKRQKSVNQWKQWIETEGKTAKLTFPLSKFGSGSSHLAGNTLLAFGYQNKVAEYTPDDKEIWSYPAQGAWSAEKMANGNVLIAEYNGNRVIEVNMESKIVWEYAVTNPLNAKSLENGNVLIAQYAGNKALEVSSDKKIVWEHATRSSCCQVHRLANGNTLIADSTAVYEVTPEGKSVWDYPLNQSFGCAPLENGNVLITSLEGKVVEVTRDKHVVWEFSEANCVDAFRLANGNTLITGASRFIEVTADKQIIWEKTGCNYGTARR